MPSSVADAVIALAQALVPLRALVAIGLGAAAYWLIPARLRQLALLVISLLVIVLGYQRSLWLVIGVVGVGTLTYLAARRGVSRRITIGGLVALYTVLHALFGLLMFTPWLEWTGVSPYAVLPTIGLTVAFTFLRLVHFAADYTASSQQLAERVTPCLLTFWAWCLFFPTFVHLPLIRYPDWAQQFERPTHGPRFAELRTGMLRVGQGLLKGALVGAGYAVLNPFGVLLNPSQSSAAQFFGAALIAAVSYYIGFSAYVDIGIGAARLYGIVLPENFAPAWVMVRVSRMRDFWRNWNITVTRWLYDYVYLPLGGHRIAPVRNVMLTMIACGLWHSISIYGLLWGAGLGLLLIAEHGWNRLRIYRGVPEIQPWLRRVLLVCALSTINLALTPYGYDPHWGRYLYPLYWLGVGR